MPLVAFVPDHRTRSKNILLQRQLSVQCDSLNKESEQTKRRLEEQQLDCLTALRNLRKEAQRCGAERDTRPRRLTSVSETIGIREKRSKSLSSVGSYSRPNTALPSLGSYSRPNTALPSVDSRKRSVQAQLVNRPNTSSECPKVRRSSPPEYGFVRDVKVYKFERLVSEDPDTEAFTVYCHNPPRKVSRGTPASEAFSLVPQVFFNYNDEIEWKDVKTITNCLNHSDDKQQEKRLDARAPFVLAQIEEHPPTGIRKARSMSYSGSTRASFSASSAARGRERSATVGHPFLSSRNKQAEFYSERRRSFSSVKRSASIYDYKALLEATVSQRDLKSCKPTDHCSYPDSFTEDGLQEDIGQQYVHESTHEDKPAPYLAEMPTSNRPELKVGESNLTEVGNTDLSEVIPNKTADDNNADETVTQTDDSGNRIKKPVNKKRLRKTANKLSSTVARSSHEARMRRKSSEQQFAVKTVAKAEEDSRESESSDSENSEDMDENEVENCVQKEISSLMSNMSFSDNLEKQVTSYLSTEKVKRSTPVKTPSAASLEPTNAKPKLNLEAKLTTDTSKTKTNNNRKGEAKITNRKLLELIRRPQMQFQMLLNKIRDAKMAAERADRLKPRVNKPIFKL